MLENEVIHKSQGGEEYPNWIGHILRTNCVAEHVTEEKRSASLRGTARRFAAQLTKSLCWLASFHLDRTRIG